MSPKRFSLVLLVCLSLLGILALGGAVGGKVLLEKQSDKLTELKLQSKVQEQQQNSLTKAKKDIAAYSELNTIAKTLVPRDKDQAKTVREIASIASESGVSLQFISFPTSTLGQKPASSSNDGTSGSAAAASNSLTQLKPVSGLEGVYQMDINVQSSTSKLASFDQLTTFLSKLEKNRRTAQVSSLTVNPDSKNRNLISFSLTITVYVKP
jgi:hypothetical protein